MNKLAYQLGLSQDLAFYDVYSLTDPDLLALIPRPVYALLAIIPMSESWKESREEEDGPKEIYDKAGPEEPVVWFKQTIGHACGSIGLLHSVLNGPAVDFIKPGSDLEKLLHDAIPLKMADRANMLSESGPFEMAHEAAAQLGDTVPPNLAAADKLYQHFVTFVKAKDGHLWELEGSRKGPLKRGALNEDEDALSEKALSLGLGRLINMERNAGGDLRFSCIALASKSD
jgi:ubiquitin carboxyl-terminal hydrolase L3